MMKVAVAWLRKEDWPRWQEIDPELLPYDRWLSKINQAIAAAERTGVVAEKVVVEPDAFVQWCDAHGKAISSRAEYAAEELFRRTAAR